MQGMIDHDAITHDDIADRLALTMKGQRDSMVDPLHILLDPEFGDALWEYEGSRVGPEIPGSLHDAQKKAFGSDRRHRFLFWGNQAGKTTLGAIECALVALGRHPTVKARGGALVWASALTWELWENILLPELLTWLPADRVLEAPDPFTKSTKRIIKVRADDGSTSMIVGKSAQSGRGTYQSAKVHFAWFDEEHPESIWDEVMLRLVRFGGRTLTTATPLLGLTWVYHRLYLAWQRGDDVDLWCSHAGLMDNPAIEAEQIEMVRRQFAGDPAQLAARLYGKFMRPSGLALQDYDPNRNLETFTAEMVRQKTAASRSTPKGWGHVCGIDFGFWRFAFLHAVVDPAGRCHIVKEYFSQEEGLDVRAKAIHEWLDSVNAPPGTRIYGDAANPTDIETINREFKRINSPYSVRAVRGENKARRAGATLVNALFKRGALLISRESYDADIWYRGKNAASDGYPQGGSRLLYEIGQWRYTAPKQDDQAQKDDPDDDSADGADCIAALRYLVMSHYRKPKKGKKPKKKPKNVDLGYERMKKQVQERIKRGAPPHAETRRAA